MRITDCHIHVGAGKIDIRKAIGRMDEIGLNRILLMSDLERTSLARTEKSICEVSRIVEASGGRISGLAFVNPKIKGTRKLAVKALKEMGFSGLKMMPDHWYPYDEDIEPFWEAMDDVKARILFHTGILYAFDDSSRFCKPLYLEKLLHYPNIKFAMAHISWPWCEECLAVMGRMKDAVGYVNKDWQSYIDITPGTPAHIRKQALKNAIEFCGADRIMFGSDDRLPGDFENFSQVLKNDMEIFKDIGLSKNQIERIMSGTADELFPAVK